MNGLLIIFVVLSLCLHALSAILLYGILRHITRDESSPGMSSVTDLLRSWDTGVSSPSEREDALYDTED